MTEYADFELFLNEHIPHYTSLTQVAKAKKKESAMAAETSGRRVVGYPDEPVQERKEISLRTYEYKVPFNYLNIDVDRVWTGGEKHGMELYAIKTTDGTTASTQAPGDAIVITEEDPIVQVAVVGSACTPPGSIMIEATTIDGEAHPGENKDALPVRFRIDNLWGMHLRADLVNQGGTFEALPISGMSCAIFEIPPSKSVRVMSAGAIPAWSNDNYPDDAHYSVRFIRTTVAVGSY